MEDRLSESACIGLTLGAEPLGPDPPPVYLRFSEEAPLVLIVPSVGLPT